MNARRTTGGQSARHPGSDAVRCTDQLSTFAVPREESGERCRLGIATMRWLPSVIGDSID